MRKRTSAFFSSFLILAFLVFTGCDSSTGPDDDNGNSENQAPTADAGSAQTVDVDEEVTLDGSGSSDPDGDDLTFSWSLSGPDGSTAALNSPDQADPTFTPDVAGEYTATLTVTDPDRMDDTDDVVITAEGASTVEISSDINSDRTLAAGPLYRVTSVVTVGAQLTIEPGVRIEFAEAAGLRVTGDNASLQAEGTEEEPIVMTGEREEAGFWNGIVIYRGPVTSRLSHVEIGYGGREAYGSVSEAANISLDRENRVELSNVRVHDSNAYGLYVDQRSVNLVRFEENTFENNATAPVSIPSQLMGAMDSASSFTGNSADYVHVRQDGGISAESSIAKLDAPYRVEDVVHVDADVTIEPGVTIEFEEAAGMVINEAGSLTADGLTETEEEDPITFTGVEETPGYWRGIVFYRNRNSTNRMRHVIVEYGGREPYGSVSEAANIALDRENRLELTDVTSRHSAGYGLFVDQPSVVLPVFSENTFTSNAEAPVYIPSSLIGAIDWNSFYNGNGGDYVLVRNDGGINAEASVDQLKVPYRFEDVVRVEADLTIDSGVTIEFAEAAGMAVYEEGSLTAEGSDVSPITFTGVEETPGYWRGIVFYRNRNSTNRLEHVIVEYGGREPYGSVNEAANIALDRENHVELVNSTISQSAGYGVWIDASSVTFDASGNTYNSNASGDVGQ